MTTPSKSTPAKNEAQGNEIHFTYKGEEYVAPPGAEWDVDVLELLEDGMLTKALRMLLAPEEWARFKATKPKAPDLVEFMNAISGNGGVEGN